jgi:hypothetical protein
MSERTDMPRIITDDGERNVLFPPLRLVPPPIVDRDPGDETDDFSMRVPDPPQAA